MSFFKGFALGFGLMLCFFVGIVVTKSYEIFIQPKYPSQFSIHTQGLNLTRAKELAAQYSAELGKTCQISELSIDLLPQTPMQQANSTTAHDEKTAAAQNEQNEQDGTAHDENAPSEPSEPSAEPDKSTPLAPVYAPSNYDYLRLECGR